MRQSEFHRRMTIRNLDESEARVSRRVSYRTRHVVSDRFQQTLPGHEHANADTFQTRVCFLSSRSSVHHFHTAFIHVKKQTKPRTGTCDDDGDRQPTSLISLLSNSCENKH